MRILIPGGSGQVGTLLARHFHTKGHDVTVLSRSPSPQPWQTLPWDAKTLGPWTQALEGADLVINLAGRSVNCRYTEQNKRDMMDSRTLSTRILGEAIARAKSPPRLWLQASTATIYAHRLDAPNDEYTGIIDGSSAPAPASWHYSVEIAQAWELECTQAPTPHTRKVLLRSAMTMSPDKGGIFDTLLTLTRRGLGGRASRGNQYISWIHETDFINAIHFLIDRDGLSGPINICAPNPLPNALFMRTLRSAAGVTIGLPATKWMLELGAIFMHTETELILKSRRVIPTRLLESGFHFKFPHWPEAARDLCHRSHFRP